MSVEVLVGDSRQMLGTLDASSVQTCVTSPPYFGLRDYGVPRQIGLEASVDEYVAQLVAVFREVRRVLADDGTLWLNLGDSYNGKQLAGVPWRVAFALQADGWLLRSDIIWQKPNPMPESVRDRPTKAHEYVFLFAKNERYLYNANAIAEPVTASTLVRVNQPTLSRQAGSTRQPGKSNGPMKACVKRQDGCSSEKPTRNKRTVWTVGTQPFKGAHFATFPPALITPCVLAGSRIGDTVLDPFGGAGTTGLVAQRLGRDAVLIEINPEYAAIARERIKSDAPLLLAGDQRKRDRDGDA